jgi:hypothetical protein
MKDKDIAYAIISGTLEFPMDMLRYDRCFPATEEYANIISRTFHHPLERWEVVVKKVLLEKRKKNSPSPFTEGRWRSFGCNIQEIGSLYER